MNTSTEHERQLVDKLKSLSFEPLTLEPGERKRVATRVAIPFCAIAIAAAVGAPLFAYGDRLLNLVGIAEPGLVDGNYTDGMAPDKNLSAESAAVGEVAVDRQAGPKTTPARNVTGSGHVVALTHTTVFSKYAGRIAQVTVEVGDKVGAGQTLARLDDAAARFNLSDARISKRSAQFTVLARQIDLEEANASLDRSKRLAEKNLLSAQDLEKAVTAQKRAANDVGQAEQTLAKAALDIAKAEEVITELTVKAPIAGTVTARNAEPGELVLAQADAKGLTDALVTITDTDNLAIDIDIAESSIAHIEPGLFGEAILDGFPDQPFKVKVSKIEPVASVERGTVRLRLSVISPPSGIRPSMAARVSIASPTNIVADREKGTE